MVRWSSPYWRPLEAFGWHSSRMTEEMPPYLQVIDEEGLMYINTLIIVYARYYRLLYQCYWCGSYHLCDCKPLPGSWHVTSMALATAVVVGFLRPNNS